MSRVFKRSKEGQVDLEMFECDGCGCKIQVVEAGNGLPANWYDDENRDEVYCEECFENLYSTCENCNAIDKVKYFRGFNCLSCWEDLEGLDSAEEI